ncbi:UNVERIFIED_CONTAM: hypothetical protein Sindi_2487500, partial [Sesamum indicum]
KHNDMADALSRKLIEKYVTALTVVESDFLDEIHESSQKDAGGIVFVLTGALHRYLLRRPTIVNGLDIS